MAGRLLAALPHAGAVPAAPPPPQDKVQAFWDISRRELGDARAEARLKDRELEETQARAAAAGCWVLAGDLSASTPPLGCDARRLPGGRGGRGLVAPCNERRRAAARPRNRRPAARSAPPPRPGALPLQDAHALALKVYKQRVKHLLFEQGAQVEGLKAAGEAALKAQVRRAGRGARAPLPAADARRAACRACPPMRPCCLHPPPNTIHTRPPRAAAVLRQADAAVAQEAALADDKRRLKQHVREQEASGEELLRQFRRGGAGGVA